MNELETAGKAMIWEGEKAGYSFKDACANDAVFTNKMAKSKAAKWTELSAYAQRVQSVGVEFLASSSGAGSSGDKVRVAKAALPIPKRSKKEKAGALEVTIGSQKLVIGGNPLRASWTSVDRG